MDSGGWFDKGPYSSNSLPTLPDIPPFQPIVRSIRHAYKNCVLACEMQEKVRRIACEVPECRGSRTWRRDISHFKEWRSEGSFQPCRATWHHKEMRAQDCLAQKMIMRTIRDGRRRAKKSWKNPAAVQKCTQYSYAPNQITDLRDFSRLPHYT